MEGKEGFPAAPVAAMKNPIVIDKDYLFAFEQHEVYVPKNTFYQSIDLVINENKDTLIIEEIPFPQRKGFELSVAIPKALDSIERQQLSLAVYDPKEEEEEKEEKNNCAMSGQLKRTIFYKLKTLMLGNIF